MNAAAPRGQAAPCSADTLVFSSPGGSPARAELLSICERLEVIWDGRSHSELELWKTLRRELAETSTVEEALRIYSESAAQRMRMALENAQRIFEEHQEIVARFSRPTADRGTKGASDQQC
jgi:hypothetical protein